MPLDREMIAAHLRSALVVLQRGEDRRAQANVQSAAKLFMAAFGAEATLEDVCIDRWGPDYQAVAKALGEAASCDLSAKPYYRTE